MRAAVFRAIGEPIDIRHVSDPTVSEDGVVLETEACGICRSDWHAWRGDWDWLRMTPSDGQILGHEPAGRVVDIGPDVETVVEGDRVVVPFFLGDGTCHACRTGHSNLCENGSMLGFEDDAQGAFAEYVPVPNADHNVVRLPDGLSPVDMAGLGCRFVTAFHTLAHVAPVSAGDRVAVHGCGGVGLSAVHIADALGATVVAVDIEDRKLSRAVELGANETVNAAAVGDVSTAIRDLTDGGVEISIDAVGHADTFRNSLLGLRRRGDHVQIGLGPGEEFQGIDVPVDVLIDSEISVHGAKGMQSVRYEEIFRMVANGSLDPGRLVDRTVPLEAITDVFAAMDEYDTGGITVVDEFS